MYNSKDPYRLFWLQHSGMFRTRAIHLVRDPRAFVGSMTKDDPTGLTAVFRYTAQWIVENAIIAAVVGKSIFDENVRHVTYDELAQPPKQTLLSIADWLDLDYDPLRVDTFREYENHALLGNMMRWRESEGDIYYDESWRQHRPVPIARLIFLLASPFARHCGYPELHEVDQ